MEKKIFIKPSLRKVNTEAENLLTGSTTLGIDKGPNSYNSGNFNAKGSTPAVNGAPRMNF